MTAPVPSVVRPSPPFWPIRLGVAAALAAVVALYAICDPAASGPFPRCLFHDATGLCCPGCGGQRALHALLHLDVMAALRRNALAVVVVPLLGVHVARWLAGRGAGGPLSALGRSRFGARALLVAVVVFAVVRNLPWSAFDGLRPD